MFTGMKTLRIVDSLYYGDTARDINYSKSGTKEADHSSGSNSHASMALLCSFRITLEGVGIHKGRCL